MNTLLNPAVASHMQGVSVVIRTPGQPDKEVSVLADEAGARRAALLSAAAASSRATRGGTNAGAPVKAPDGKKRKLDVASSVADRAGGPGTDPASRFAYVYTGKHDHGTLQSEQDRLLSKKWSGISSALSEMKQQTDAYLTDIINREAE